MDNLLSLADASKAEESGVLRKVAPAQADLHAKSQEVFAHLSAVVSYYRTCISLVQKVGNPNDAVYRQDSITNAKLVASYAFQAGTAVTTLLAAYARRQPDAANGNEAPSEARKLQIAMAAAAQRSQSLKARLEKLKEQLLSARGGDLQNIRQEMERLQGPLELTTAISNALAKIADMSDARGDAGSAGDLERLKQTVPGITDMSAKVIPAPLTPLDEARSAGITGQATVLFHLLSARSALDQLMLDTEGLHREALALRSPWVNLLNGMLQKAQTLSERLKPSIADETEIQKNAREFDSITAAFKVISAGAVPLSEEIIALERSRTNLHAWHAALDTEYHDALQALLGRLLVIAIALLLIVSAGEIWRRATIRYIQEIRRRRQLLGLRRLVTYFLCGLVLLFGFSTHFDSLATFAGFIMAGLAVGLQTILLSVAAYFFIIGRYGVRVGDRITVAGVTGDVVEVGLVRFYVMELAHSGFGRQPTGRVAVFSNSILFQAGTPLFKQMPGTDYEWQEMTALLSRNANYTHAAQVLLGSVQRVYDSYKQRIEQQHHVVQFAMDTTMNAPRIESCVHFVDAGLQLTVRFPVAIPEVASITRQVAESLLRLIESDKSVQEAVMSHPVIRAAAKS